MAQPFTNLVYFTCDLRPCQTAFTGVLEAICPVSTQNIEACVLDHPRCVLKTYCQNLANCGATTFTNHAFLSVTSDHLSGAAAHQ